MQDLLKFVRRHRAGDPVGITAVCSAHPIVLEAALSEGARHGTSVLIEATSNQVNQFGGYTGMRPADFHRFVSGIAAACGVPASRLLLGGDHLGPNCWQGEPSEVAMVKSEALVAEYVRAGFRKIHLDCSMACADDGVPLPDTLVAARAARLALACEHTWGEVGGEPPVYVIGTEVPVPGGAHEDLGELELTRPAAAAETLAVHEEVFRGRGLHAAWERVIGLVVQPGVEFDHHKVVDYQPAKARALSAFIERVPGIVFEAHSTDYQTPQALAQLVRDHFAILKVGPGATFALRETLWGLADIEREWLGEDGDSGFKQRVLDAMREHPEHWQKYYAEPARVSLDLQFSLSDRIRYYWASPAVAQACEALVARLESRGQPVPLTLLSQYLPRVCDGVRAGDVGNDVRSLLREGVAHVLRDYASACNQSAAPQGGTALEPAKETV
jgi:D-tagatose-1,6-bisphosphate aldolase subunit GatZ/KbaZ